MKHINKEHQTKKRYKEIIGQNKKKDKGKLENTFVNDMELIEKSQEHDPYIF